MVSSSTTLLPGSAEDSIGALTSVSCVRVTSCCCGSLYWMIQRGLSPSVKRAERSVQPFPTSGTATVNGAVR